MRNMAITLVALGLVVASTAFAAHAVRISQIFGSNGTEYSYAAAFVELFNNGPVEVDLSGWSLQYGSATNTGGFFTTQVFTFPSGSRVGSCSYQLLQLTSEDYNLLPVRPDHAVAGINLSYQNGKLVLTDTAPQAIPCLGAGYSPPSGTIVDAGGYGAGAGLCYETAAAPAGGDWVLRRKLGGMQDTDDNSADFEVLNVTRNQAVMHNHAMGNPDCVAAQPTGACCFNAPASCLIMNAADCNAENGAYAGDGTDCTACGVVPADKATWGRVKIIYR